MKKLNTLFLLLLVPLLSYGQFFGLGGQYSQKGDGQFFVSASFPAYHQENILNAYVSSGLEYTTPGGAKMSGLHIKPVQISSYLSEDFFNDKPYTVLLGLDAGYLLDFRKGYKNAIVFTPNLYIDYKIFFVKTGYDIDVSHGRNQFSVRAGIGIGMGALKMFGNTKIR